MIPKKEWARDTLRMLLLLGAAVAVCSVLSRVHDDNNPFAVLIFVLAVAIVALVTNGYVWGVLASVIGVFCVNYMFTYPFWSFDMSITGYPLTFVVMLVVSVVISTLTTRVKQTERLRYEIESEKLRADLLRALSHDLRTPLASIEGRQPAAGAARPERSGAPYPAGADPSGDPVADPHHRKYALGHPYGRGTGKPAPHR